MEAYKVINNVNLRNSQPPVRSFVEQGVIYIPEVGLEFHPRREGFSEISVDSLHTYTFKALQKDYSAELAQVNLDDAFADQLKRLYSIADLANKSLIEQSKSIEDHLQEIVE